MNFPAWLAARLCPDRDTATMRLARRRPCRSLAGENRWRETMAKLNWDHVHIRTRDPEAMATWFEKNLGAEVIRTMQQGAPRIDLKLGGANIFIAPVKDGDGTNTPPAI